VRSTLEPTAAPRQRAAPTFPWSSALGTLRTFYNVGEWRVPVLRERGAPAFHVLVSTVLSHRSADSATLTAFHKLITRYPSPQALSKADRREVERLIRSVGIARNKAAGLISMASALVDRYEGSVPSDLEELLTIPMVGPKTAEAVRVFAFRKRAIPVDTHIHRVANRLGVVVTKSPLETQFALAGVVPRRFWGELNPVLVQHGQNLCSARAPKCGKCPISSLCDYRAGGTKR
jgi:endonuclease-3